jgi:menaquinone-dependent protoporphyrinogen oxidase
MKVLVATASRHGATDEIATEIARTLSDRGLDAEVVGAGDILRLDGYDAVVLGSAVYMGHWLKPARKFVEIHADQLRVRPTWLFSSGPIEDPPQPQERETGNADEILVATGAREHRVFAGKVDKSQLGLPERAVLRTVGAAEGDYRDWSEIRTWATKIATSLVSEL